MNQQFCTAVCDTLQRDLKFILDWLSLTFLLEVFLCVKVLWREVFPLYFLLMVSWVYVMLFFLFYPWAWRQLLFMTIAQFLHLLWWVVATFGNINTSFNKLLPLCKRKYFLVFIYLIKIFYTHGFICASPLRVQISPPRQHRSSSLFYFCGSEQKEEH